MQCEATGLGFVCFVVVNPCVLSANRVVFGLLFFFCFISFLFTPPPSRQQEAAKKLDLPELEATVEEYNAYAKGEKGGGFGHYDTEMKHTIVRGMSAKLVGLSKILI